ncbi:hypothetical protein I7I51_03468 [Histoplasma capsulatum]|uniref:Uncharacterized protein n=1 Tax=Ajellomyces capsulatus TaxID=5037 RepID=A0A8A1M6I8_AJECA|nr:hypothetical protein I7I51_03468 [Histoplasma capsulatum]
MCSLKLEEFENILEVSPCLGHQLLEILRNESRGTSKSTGNLHLNRNPVALALGSFKAFIAMPNGLRRPSSTSSDGDNTSQQGEIMAIHSQWALLLRYVESEYKERSSGQSDHYRPWTSANQNELPPFGYKWLLLGGRLLRLSSSHCGHEKAGNQQCLWAAATSGYLMFELISCGNICIGRPLNDTYSARTEQSLMLFSFNQRDDRVIYSGISLLSWQLRNIPSREEKSPKFLSDTGIEATKKA